jgi:hypothetical protein
VRPPRAPSWLGTLVVALAVIVMCLRAAMTLRRSVSAPAPAPASASALP